MKKRNGIYAAVSVGVLAAACVIAGCSWLFPPVYISVKAGETNACAVDDSGKIHLVFSFNTGTERGVGESGLRYTIGVPGASWTTEEVYDAGGSAVYADAIAIDPDGNIHVLFRVGEVAYHAWKAPGGIWETEVFVEENSGPIGGMAFDSEGGMHIVHSGYQTGTLLFDNLRPFYSYKSPGASSFVTTQIEYGGGWADVNYGAMGSIAVDATGKAHMTFGRQGNILVLTLAKLYYATAEPAGGTVNPAVEIAGDVSDLVDNCLRIGPDGTIHVVYLGYEDSRSVLKYRTSEDGGETWGSAHTVDDTAYSGNDPVLAVDSAGGLHVAYRVETDGTTIPAVRYAHMETASSEWTAEDVSTDSYGEVSLALDSDETPVIFWARDTGEADNAAYLEFVVSGPDDGGGWTTAVVMEAVVP